MYNDNGKNKGNAYFRSVLSAAGRPAGANKGEKKGGHLPGRSP